MNKTYSDLSKKVNVMYMENINNLSCFFSTNTYLRTNLLPINKNMIDTDIFIEQMLIKVIPDIDDEGLEMMIEETKPVLYDRVMTHIVGQIDEKDGQ